MTCEEAYEMIKLRFRDYLATPALRDELRPGVAIALDTLNSDMTRNAFLYRCKHQEQSNVDMYLGPIQ
jgi:hypothetical protein